MIIQKLAHPDDVRDLDEAQRKAVVQALIDLAAGRRQGKTLEPAAEHQKFRANLAGLRALPVYDPSPARYEEAVRIVYAQRGSEIDVVAIGPRLGSAVYRLAAERLAPRPRPRRMRR